MLITTLLVFQALVLVCIGVASWVYYTAASTFANVAVAGGGCLLFAIPLALIGFRGDELSPFVLYLIASLYLWGMIGFVNHVDGNKEFSNAGAGRSLFLQITVALLLCCFIMTAVLCLYNATTPFSAIWYMGLWFYWLVTWLINNYMLDSADSD